MIVWTDHQRYCAVGRFLLTSQPHGCEEEDGHKLLRRVNKMTGKTKWTMSQAVMFTSIYLIKFYHANDPKGFCKFADTWIEWLSDVHDVHIELTDSDYLIVTPMHGNAS